MRHIRSICYALVLAPAIWILCGVGFDQDLTGRARDNGGIESFSGVLLLLLAGAAYAILLLTPISPAGPLLAGLAYLGAGAWARIAPESYAGVWPSNLAADGFDVSTPGYGLVVLLAVPLLCTALSARRWRAWEPPQLLLFGTVGRARVAGTPMAAERTSVIPQAPYGRPGADATQVVVHAPVGRPDERTTVLRGDDGDEKTTVMQLGGPVGAAPPFAAPAAAPVRQAEEPTALLGVGRPENISAADERTEVMSAAEEPTAATQPTVTASDEPTAATEPTAADEPTEVVPAATAAGGEEATHAVAVDLPDAADDTTRDVVAASVAPDGSGDETTDGADEITHVVASADDDAEDTTRDVMADDEKTTLLVLPSSAAAPETESPPTADAGSDDEKTQVFQVPAPPEARGNGEQTQVIRGSTVDPPGDRTQMLTLPVPSPATEQPEPTKPMSIVGEERPDPGEDPTTRLSAVREETPARPQRDRRAMTVTNLERPADEAEDDTRPLSLPTPRKPADDDTTRTL